MCQIEIFRFRCVCPERDEPVCPHHKYVETNSDSAAPNVNSDGLYSRQACEPQRHKDWEELRDAGRWRPCQAYLEQEKSNSKPQDTSPECPNTVYKHYRMANLCDHCRLGHLGYKEGDKAALSHKWAAVAPEEAWAWADDMKANRRGVTSKHRPT